MNVPPSTPPVEHLTRSVMSLLTRLTPDLPLSLPVVPNSSRSSVDEKKRAYQDFLDRLGELRGEDPETLSRIGIFLDSLAKRKAALREEDWRERERESLENNDGEHVPGDAEPFGDEVRVFLNKLARDMSVLRPWKNCTDPERVNLGEGLEKLVMTNLHKHLFQPTAYYKERDEELHGKIQALKAVLDPVKHLDVDQALLCDDNEPFWDRACNELQRLSNFKSPREKMACISNCCRIVADAIKKTSSAPNVRMTSGSSDVFVPCLVYVVARANPDELYSNVEYVAAYRGREFMMGERGQFFMHFASASSFWRRADHTSLSMTKKEYNSCFSPSVVAAAAVVLASSRMSPVKPTFRAPDQDEQDGGELTNKNNKYSAVWQAERFRFENMSIETLRVADVENLLQEYKILAKTCREFL